MPITRTQICSLYCTKYGGKQSRQVVGVHGRLRANLDEVVEDPEALRVLAGLDIDEGADLGCGEGDVLVVHDDLELLAADAVGLGPVAVVLLHNLRRGRSRQWEANQIWLLAAVNPS